MIMNKFSLKNVKFHAGGNLEITTAKVAGVYTKNKK